jgi:hypothetical protein
MGRWISTPSMQRATERPCGVTVCTARRGAVSSIPFSPEAELPRSTYTA